MGLVYAGVCCHAPGITNRPEAANPGDLQSLLEQFQRMREEIVAEKTDAIAVVSSEHFANFFTHNMPTFAIGMADHYEGPIEDPAWLGISATVVPGDSELSRRLIKRVMQNADVAYAEEWKFDHGMMVPLSKLTPEYQTPVIPININCQAPPLVPLRRSYEFGQALRLAIDTLPERIALIGTGGTSHWPCTPDSGKINETWDRDFLRRWCEHDVDAMTDYSDGATVRDAGAGALEIRTSIAIAGAAGGKGNLRFYKPIPVFACGCLIATMAVA